MTNDNCLEGIGCPQCKQEKKFTITALVDCEVTDDGAWATDNSHYDWGDESDCSCPYCGRFGKLKEFKKDNQK